MKRHWYRSAVIGFGPMGVLAAYGTTAVAQGADSLRMLSCDPFAVEPEVEAAVARDYAPVFYFAPQERYFPTFPFFHAFDGIDQTGIGASAGLTDLDDPGEVVAALSANRSDTRLVHNLMDRLYRRGPDGADRARRPSAVFYHIERHPWSARHESESGAVWRYLRSDEQAWRRSGIDTVYAGMDATGQGFAVIEYYLYYVNDFGLEGHPYDIEFTYVYLPCYPTEEAFEEGQRRTARRRLQRSPDLVTPTDFRVVVGAGHTDFIPANVLVHLPRAPNGPPNGVANADSIRPHIIVELGDHSSATDRPPYRRFRSGWDINWHIQEVWGVRDAQATHGLGFLGQYDISMTFPRDEESGGVGLRPRLPPDATGRWPAADSGSGAYSLVPVTVLQELFEQLAAFQAVDGMPQLRYDGDPARFRVDSLDRLHTRTPEVVIPRAAHPACVARYREWDRTFLLRFKRLSEWTDDGVSEGWNFDQFGLLPFDRRAEAVCLMRWWLTDLVTYRSRFESAERVDFEAKSYPGDRMRIWKNHHYLRPTYRALKNHLFRPVAYQEGHIHLPWFSVPSGVVAGAMAPLAFGGKLSPLGAGIGGGIGLLATLFTITPARPSFTWYPEDRFRLQLGTVITVQEELPIQLPGVIEIHAGIYGETFRTFGVRRRIYPAFSLAYERHYARQGASWFGEIGVFPRRSQIDPDRGPVTVSGGLSILPVPNYKMRIRIGPRIDLRDVGQTPGAVTWGIQVSFVQ